MDQLDDIRTAIAENPSNAWGRAAQESGIPWNDPSGVRLRDWLGVAEGQFYDPATVPLLPMDFFYPGKGASGDLRLTVLIGAYAQRHYLGPDAKRALTETVAAFRDNCPRGFRSSIHRLTRHSEFGHIADLG